MATRQKFYSDLGLCVLVVALCLSLLPMSSAAQTAGKEGWPKKIVISVTGGEAGPAYPILSGLGRMIEKHLAVSVGMTSASGHDSANLLQKGEIHIMLPSAFASRHDLRGTGPSEKWGPTPLRAWLQAQIFEQNIIAKPGIKSFKDLEGKIICIGPRAVPIPEIIFNTLADIHGVDVKKVRMVKWDRPTEAYDGFKAGRFDAIAVPGFYPTALTTELLLSHPGHILHMDDAQMAKLQKQLPWVMPLTIPPGTYKGMDKAVQTPAIAMFLVTHRDIPESLVYSMTKMVWDHFDEFSTFHPTCKKFSPADVTKVVDTCPYHKGAIKYYRETGVWTKELDQRQAATLASLPPSVR